jgi:hypothetical protein
MKRERASSNGRARRLVVPALLVVSMVGATGVAILGCDDARMPEPDAGASGQLRLDANVEDTAPDVALDAPADAALDAPPDTPA